MPVTVIFDPATILGVAVPVPPFATANIPAKVTAPEVAVDGVKPVVPALKVETPPDAAAHDAVVPFDVKT